MPPQTTPKASIGRTVHYVLNSGPRAGKHRPAIIVDVDEKDDSNVVLQVFTNGDGDPNREDGLPGVFREAAVLFNEKAEPGTWHWPEKVD